MVNGSDIIGYAKQFIGVPYVSCGTTPKGFDCSGLVQFVYGHFGINISRTTRTQINDGREVGRISYN
jgi:cell wall-associated NlpC family hydrolase